MKDEKYNFVDYIAAVEGDKFEVLETSWLKWADALVT